jgi:hypothetical protein
LPLAETAKFHRKAASFPAMAESMKELWTGRVEVLTPPTEFGDTKAFTNFVTWASNVRDFRDHVAKVLEEYGWSLIGVEECGPVSAYDQLGEEVAEEVERARDIPEACIYTTFHYYPSRSA